MLINHTVWCIAWSWTRITCWVLNHLGFSVKQENSYANAVFEGKSKEWKRRLSEHVREGIIIPPFLGVCEQKQFLIIFLRCYCCNTFTVTFIQGGKDDCHTGDMPAVVLGFKQAGLYPGASWDFLYQPVCWHNSVPWHLTWPRSPDKADSHSVCSGFFSVAGFVSPKPAKYNLKGLRHVCQISGFQVEKNKVAWEVTVQLCSGCLQQQLELWLSCFSSKMDMGGSRDISVEPLA